MWQINALEFKRFQGQPVPFTELVDALIAAEMAIAGVSDSALSANLRVTIRDGGVDTCLSTSIAASASGWLTDPTCWQYKTMPYKTVTLRALKNEIRKKHAKELIEQGYAYRLCISDSMPPSTKQRWEDHLAQEANKINPSAKTPKVITAEHLGLWISRLPAQVVRFFQKGVPGFLDVKSWQPNALRTTPTYLPVKEWSGAEKILREHLDMTKPEPDVLLRLQGEAGVGKTRLVYETINHLKGAELLALYTPDDQSALTIAPLLAMNPNSTAILVVDDCSLESSAKLSELLKGYSEKVRVVAIDNSATRNTGMAPELHLERIPQETVNEILEKNFGAVPAESRRLYGELSGGFIRFAAELCKSHSEISKSGNIRGTLPGVRAYLVPLLDDADYLVLQAISLVHKVGFKDEVANEIEDLCNLLRLDRDDLVRRAKRLKDAPGFITQAGRYFYCTPEIVAHVTFEDAWERWIADDPNRVLAQIPASLLQTFQQRVSTVPDQKVREVVASFFRDWARTLKVSDLVHHEILDRLLALGETAPDFYLALIAKLMTDSSIEDLRTIDTRRSEKDPRRWGPRRYLVWFLEHIASFPEYFAEAELALFRLAQAESEPDISNNATGEWKGLFLIFCGTAAPYLDRLDILRTRLFSSDSSGRLAIDALEGALRSFSGGTRTVGPKVFAGRIVPQSWYETSPEQASEWLNKIIDLLLELASSGRKELEEGAQNVAFRNLRGLLYRGKLESLEQILVPAKLSSLLLPRVLEQIDNFFKYDLNGRAKGNFSEDYLDSVSAWQKRLIPTDIHGRIVTLVGKNPWLERNSREESKWKADLVEIATILFSNPIQLTGELAWLCSPEARSAGYFGIEIGKIDEGGRYLHPIVKGAAESSNYAFTNGYLAGLLEQHPEKIDALNDLLDSMESTYPQAVFELSFVGGRRTLALERALRMVDAGKLNATRLEGFATGLHGELSDVETREILSRLVSPVQAGDRESVKAAIDFLGYRVRSEPPRFSSDLSLETLELVWSIVECSTKEDGTEPYWWSRVVEALSLVDPNRAAKIASRALTGNFFIAEEAEKTLVRAAAFAPEAVMTAVGETMLDEKAGIHFFFGVHRTLFAALPVEVVKDWLNSAGVEGARHVARHLPEPFVDPGGMAVVPPLTEFVLSRFEDDDRTFQEFCAGMHSMKSYVGDIASQVESEGAVARKFLSNKHRRIREWARLEVQSAAKEAEMWRQLDEEQKIR